MLFARVVDDLVLQHLQPAYQLGARVARLISEVALDIFASMQHPDYFDAFDAFR